MRNILISSFDMEVGGVERSLVNMLENFDYEANTIDLMLYKHQGDFMNLISNDVNLLTEIPQYTTFRKSLIEILKSRQYLIGISRALAKVKANIYGKSNIFKETGYYQMQLMWKYTLPFLPRLNKKYDVAISYLWPHYFVANKIIANKKIAWIHTDYSNIETNVKMDMKIWDRYDHIVAVSEACKQSFLKKYNELESKTVVIENIISPEFIKEKAKEEVLNPMQQDKRFKIVTVARLSHAKGIDLAVDALKVLIDKGFTNISWYVVGYGGDEAKIKELIKKNKLENYFILLGKKTNPYPYIQSCDLYVQPSRYEGKAVTVTEAKILGKPILVTNYLTSISQIQDGYDGYIAELSVNGIVDGIKKLYQNRGLRNYLISNCERTDYTNKNELEKLYKLFI